MPRPLLILIAVFRGNWFDFFEVAPDRLPKGYRPIGRSRWRDLEIGDRVTEPDGGTSTVMYITVDPYGKPWQVRSVREALESQSNG